MQGTTDTGASAPVVSTPASEQAANMADLRRTTQLGYQIDNLISELDRVRPESDRWHDLMDRVERLNEQMRSGDRTDVSHSQL